MRYFIELSYKGTAYNGWQRQNNALGVQEVVELALGKALRTPLEITGSSRTDTGVHAEQQFAHFDMATEIEDTGRLVQALNGILPFDIGVRQVFRVEDDLNSRFTALYRRYEYRIVREKNPFLIDGSYFVKGDLNINSMNEASELLVGMHDFESFSKIRTNVNNFRCTITKADWQVTNGLFVFNIQANRFLRGMVRAIVGTLLEVGRGRRSVDSFVEVLNAHNRAIAGPQAPASGLFLVEVAYPNGVVPII